jgi:hypothetical protein
MNSNYLFNFVVSFLLVSSTSATVSPVHLNFGCLKQFSGQVSYNDTQLTGSLMVRFRNNWHCRQWCDYYTVSISPNPQFANAVHGKFDISKNTGCTEFYRQYYAPKAMIRTDGKVKTFSTPVDENKEVSGWVAINDEMKFNNTHWKVVLNKPIEMIQVPLMYQDHHQKLVYTHFNFQDKVLQDYLQAQWKVPAFQADKRDCRKISAYMTTNDQASNEVLLFNPEYTLVVNHQCLMSIQMLNNLFVENHYRQERCLSLEKNDWQVNEYNGGWHNEKECTHDDIKKRKRWIDREEHVIEEITLCKSIPFARGDSYISCTDGQKLQTIPNFDEDQSVKVFFAFAKAGISTVPFIGNVLSGIVEYLEKPTSFKSIATGVAQDLKVPLEQLTTKAEIISKIGQALTSLIK